MDKGRKDTLNVVGKDAGWQHKLEVALAAFYSVYISTAYLSDLPATTFNVPHCPVLNSSSRIEYILSIVIVQ
jgi:hypothetical protein